MTGICKQYNNRLRQEECLAVMALQLHGYWSCADRTWNL